METNQTDQQQTEQPQPEQETADDIANRELREAMQKDHLAEMAKVAANITKIECEIDDLKDKIKEYKALLKCQQNALMNMARNGVPEQLTLKLEPGEEPQHCEECADPEWWSHPTNELPGLTKREHERVAEHFKTCGELCAWLGDDFRDKISGFGEKFREKLSDAVNQLAGLPDLCDHDTPAPQQVKPEPKLEPKEKSTMEIERDEFEVSAFLDEIDSMLDSPEYEYATDTLEGIRDWVKENQCYTLKQLEAVTNIREAPAEGVLK